MTLLVAFIIFSTIQECINSLPYEESARLPIRVPRPQQLTFINSSTVPQEIEDQPSGCFSRQKSDKLSLFYGRNSCTSIPKNIKLQSKHLKFGDTLIRALKHGDFQNLSHLEELQIESNYFLEKISNRTFVHLVNLVNLSITFNQRLSVIEKGAFEGLINLKRLFLNRNSLKSLSDITQSLSKRDVPNLIILVLDYNQFPLIHENDFRAMNESKLEDFSLNTCRIDYIHPQALTPLKRLRTLHLGGNNLKGLVLADMLNHSLASGLDLRTLNLYDMKLQRHLPTKLMEVIASSNISRLSLRNNQFEVIDEISWSLMPNLKSLDLRKNSALQVTDEAFNKLPKIEDLLLSDNKLTEIPKSILKLQSLTFLDMQNNSPGEGANMHFNQKDVDFSKTNLTYLNLGLNGVAHLFDTSFKGLPKLNVLVLERCAIYHIENGTFSNLAELKELNLKNNNILHGGTVPDVFYNLTKLEILNLSNCKFQFISSKSNPFDNLKSLKYLALNDNLLTSIAPHDLQHLSALKTINLAANNLLSWTEEIFSQNRNIKSVILTNNKITDITQAMFQDFSRIASVNLDQNSLLCKCSSTYKSYTSFHQATKNDVYIKKSPFFPPVYCSNPEELVNITLIDFLTDSHYGDSSCTHKSKLIFKVLPLICIFVFIAALAALSFWYRWHIKYWIFLAKLYLSRKGKLRLSENHKCNYTNYEYDTFVSYSTEDRDFVINMVTILENQHPFLRLCVYERDFQIGTIISESILESVAKSRKTLLVISENYAKSQWCRWESQICEHHRLFFENEHGEYVDDSLILIKLSTVSDAYLTPTLKYLLKTRIYLQWSEDEKKQESFWNRLKGTLGPSLYEKSGGPNAEATHM